ncbi:MAG: hypothetical protein WHS65_03815 [Melioribacteraceae bacterium]
MNYIEKYNALKNIFWDYKIENLPIDKIINHEFDSIDTYEFNLIIKRMFERLTWYELIDILGMDNIQKLLTDDLIKRIYPKELRDKYERIRRILRKEIISDAGWNSTNHKRIRASILSNRWYSN